MTRAVGPGVNEVWVGIRDAWYGYSANPKEPMKLRAMLGYLPQDFGVYPKVSAYDLLDHLARLKGLPEAPMITPVVKSEKPMTDRK